MPLLLLQLFLGFFVPRENLINRDNPVSAFPVPSKACPCAVCSSPHLPLQLLLAMFQSVFLCRFLAGSSRSHSCR